MSEPSIPLWVFFVKSNYGLSEMPFFCDASGITIILRHVYDVIKKKKKQLYESV